MSFLICLVTCLKPLQSFLKENVASADQRDATEYLSAEEGDVGPVSCKYCRFFQRVRSRGVFLKGFIFSVSTGDHRKFRPFKVGQIGHQKKNPNQGYYIISFE